MFEVRGVITGCGNYLPPSLSGKRKIVTTSNLNVLTAKAKTVAKPGERYAALASSALFFQAIYVPGNFIVFN